MENTITSTANVSPHFDRCSESCPETPFENIALSFSGGGFRAASFSLGVISYLNHLKFDDNTTLLSKVKYISSASGGTFTAGLYALYSAAGKTFDEMYLKLCEALNREELLTKALDLLNDDTAWKTRPDKLRNLINAFAMAYDTDMVFNGSTFADLLKTEPNTHLEEVCFNSTEFYKGRSFRQQVKLLPDSKSDNYFYYGSSYAFVGKPGQVGDIIPKIKLADALAASSCFPGGFEPFIYPGDFSSENLIVSQLKDALTLSPQNNSGKEKEFINAKTFGLMDGGVDDNQGLNSLMAADMRRMNGQTSFKRFDLILVNDVDSYFMDGYEVNQKTPNGFFANLNFRTVKFGVFILFLLSIAAIVTSICNGQSAMGITGALVFGLTVIPVILYFVIISKLNGRDSSGSKSKQAKKLNIEETFTPEIIRNLSTYFDKTKLGVIATMISARVGSVLTLDMDVFMKRIRQVIYENFYNMPVWKNRRKGNHIYDLSKANDMRREQGMKDFTPEQQEILKPTKKIQDCADAAFSMGTTLWFDSTQREMKKNIISCGQFTTCCNLLEYIYVFKKENPGKNTPAMDRIQAQLEKDWVKFKENPFIYYH